MTTLNFQCGHCHNLMAVGQEFLGQQVRCPHCQQVVLAPNPAAAPPPFSVEAPVIEVPRADEEESIFTQSDASGDDLFGAAALPRVEVPTEPAIVPRLALDEVTIPTDAAPPAPPRPADQPTVPYAGPQPPPPDSVTEAAPPAEAGPPASPAESPAAPAEEGLAQLTVRPRHRVGRGNPWVIPLVIAPLAFYSLMATLYILDLKFFHFFSPPPPPHPLEVLPDLEGDNKGAATRGRRSSVNIKLPEPDQPVPAQLRVPLGKTLAVGDLQVTPERVERKRIAIDISNARPEPAAEDSLALYLRLRNRSRDVTFKPMDRYFARAWTKKPSDPKPYTLLEMGDRRFYGGPLDWVPLAAARKSYIEYVHEQAVNQELKPGEEMTTFVCTNPDEHAVKALAGYQGPLVWHVQLRRGLVRWATRDGAEREDPATTVVGVEFSAADVRQADG